MSIVASVLKYATRMVLLENAGVYSPEKPLIKRYALLMISSDALQIAP
jgi:hypothetical protein